MKRHRCAKTLNWLHLRISKDAFLRMLHPDEEVHDAEYWDLGEYSIVLVFERRSLGLDRRDTLG